MDGIVRKLSASILAFSIVYLLFNHESQLEETLPNNKLFPLHFENGDMEDHFMGKS